MARTQLGSILVVIAFALTASCDRRQPLDPAGGAATLVLRVDAAGSAATLVVVEITAPDIVPPLLFNIPVSNGVAAETITVPAGTNRTFTLRAYDANGIETHSGATTVNVLPGANASVSLQLTPLAGDVPLHATLGSVTLAVTPATDTLATGDTLTFRATIRDAAGNPVPGVVRWATADPGVASVGVSGLVTAGRSGRTTIAATYLGTAGLATVTVR